jgi:RNA polymerase sigma-70 factor (ECF subfamily)
LSLDFDALYRDYKRKVFGTVRNVVGPSQELEDIVQTVFLEIHRSLPRYRGTAQLSTWIYRIAVNVSLQYIRKKKRRRFFLFLGDDTRRDALNNHDPRTRLAERERIEVLYRLVDKLSEKKRTTFILHEMEGMTVEAIAEICEVPPNTVRSRLIAARAQLTKRMRSAGLLEPSS